MQENNEILLLKYTTELKSHYERLEEIVEEHAADSQAAVEPIREQMLIIKQTETKLKPLREAFVEANNEVSGQIKAVTDETIELVKALMPKLAQLEKASMESLRRLFPRIQGSVRAIQMQNAYRVNNSG